MPNELNSQGQMGGEGYCSGMIVEKHSQIGIVISSLFFCTHGPAKTSP